MRAEKKARAEESVTVEAIHIRHFLQDTPSEQLHWQAAALARLMRVPQGFMRDKSKQRIETYAQENNHSEITLEIAEAGLAAARKAMEQAMGSDEPDGATQQPDAASNATQSKCAFANLMKPAAEQSNQNQTPGLYWQEEARKRLKRIPEGFCRDMTAKAAE
ncbi:MAG: universal stress protein UspA, partial [bacterium]|nr:universal stress protein UspA [bacterium]